MPRRGIDRGLGEGAPWRIPQIGVRRDIFFFKKVDAGVLGDVLRRVLPDVSRAARLPGVSHLDRIKVIHTFQERALVFRF